ncbi:MAG: F0F1 ATP synthase subunit delta [Candidatus Pacebacteria bacterium]|nr:F0F1 ATP synthase subunit delta [Candidatus Paceibacterota bacterium]MCF7857034.1 F0F1 ATP synthase subunit delta [Candidatus Paceibacterota bacterium]
MLVRDYRDALFELIARGDDYETTVDSFKKLLRHKKHTKLYPHVMKGLLQKCIKSEKLNTTQVTVGRQSDIETLKPNILQELSLLNLNSEFKTIIDPGVIGGYKVTSYDKVVDRTYKKKLLAVYRSLTT